MNRRIMSTCCYWMATIESIVCLLWCVVCIFGYQRTTPWQTSKLLGPVWTNFQKREPFEKWVLATTPCRRFHWLISFSRHLSYSILRESSRFIEGKSTPYWKFRTMDTLFHKIPFFRMKKMRWACGIVRVNVHCVFYILFLYHKFRYYVLIWEERESYKSSRVKWS